jgi:SAM-dependent methyltransferase
VTKLMKKRSAPEWFDHLITGAISLLFTVALGLLSPYAGVTEFSGWWWALCVVFLLLGFSMFNAIYRWLFMVPAVVPTVPQIANSFDQAVTDAGYNFCAVSSKELRLWRSPTFSYYLELNALKTMMEFSTHHTCPDFSDETEQKRIHFQNGLDLVKCIAHGTAVNQFYGMRLLIYPEDVYDEFREEIKCLIQLHALAGMHCLPVKRESLAHSLNDDERDDLKNLSQLLGQRLHDEQTALSRVDRLRLSFRDESHNPYTFSIPDYLVINHGCSYPDMKHVWWYKDDRPCNDESSKNSIIIRNKAEDCFRMLCTKVSNKAKELIWSGYAPDIFNLVPIGTALDNIAWFFSQDYYPEWFKLINTEEKFHMLKDWLRAESTVISSCASGFASGRALDVGCGWGRHLTLMLDAGVGRVAGIDSNPLMIKKAGEELYGKYADGVVELRLEDAEKISYADETFDLVICMTNTLGNLGGSRQRKSAIKEMGRVMRPGGRLVVSVYKDHMTSFHLRESSYRAVGVHPSLSDDGKVVLSTEGLVSEQFDGQQFQGEFAAAGLVREEEEGCEIDDCALIYVFRKAAKTNVQLTSPEVGKKS